MTWHFSDFLAHFFHFRFVIFLFRLTSCLFKIILRFFRRCCFLREKVLPQHGKLLFLTPFFTFLHFFTKFLFFSEKWLKRFSKNRRPFLWSVNTVAQLFFGSFFKLPYESPILETKKVVPTRQEDSRYFWLPFFTKIEKQAPNHGENQKNSQMTGKIRVNSVFFEYFFYTFFATFFLCFFLIFWLACPRK